MPASARRREIEEVLRAKVDALAASRLEELDAYRSRTEEVATPSGELLEVETWTFWDTEPWASEMYVQGKARPVSGWRRWWRYAYSTTRVPDEPAPEEPAPEGQL
jgi:hypothetical protein